ncbi:MAG: glycosyltransferase family 9 protein [Bacteroidales bacterium]|nr:glycosyltransferase family 9 protein [Bacteroidales bacterium]
MTNSPNILISRTDAIGDVILTLPLAGIIKEYYPDSKILFLGKSYTKDIISISKHVDQFINWSDIDKLATNEQINVFKEYSIDTIIHVFPNKDIARIAKSAGIKNRIGTAHRPFHWTTCNKLLNFSRKNSDLHESQLNTKLLKPIGINRSFSLSELVEYYGFDNVKPLDINFIELLDPKRFNLILHPKSKGSAREWGLENFKELIEILPSKKYKLFLSGTEEEGELFRDVLLESKNVIDISGTMSLQQFVSFIDAADGLIAASTGPLHIAAALGKRALGIYPPIRPMHPGRWMPLGINADYVVHSGECSDCRDGGACHCMLELSASIVATKL